MNNLLKRIINAALAVILLLTSCSLAVFAAEAEPAEDEPANLTVSLSGDIEGTPMDQSGNMDSMIGCQFAITAPALSVEVCCPTWSRPKGGFFTFSIFKFDTDYDTTVGKAPLKSVRYDEFDDNQWLILEFPESEPLAPGEYIIILSEPEPGLPSGVWLDKNCDQQLCWTDGVVDPKHSLRSRITFVGRPESYFGTPTPPKPETQDDPSERGTAPYIDMTVLFNDPDWSYIFAETSAVSFDIDEYMAITVMPADDPWLVIKFDDICSDPGVLVKKYPVMKMKLRRTEETDPLKGEIFYLTENSPNAKAGNDVWVDYQNTTEWQYITVDFSAEKRCRDYLAGVRFDLYDHAPEGAGMDVEWITFFESTEAAEQFDGDFSKYMSMPTEKPVSTPAPTYTPSAPTAEATQNAGEETAAAPTEGATDDNKSIAKNNKFPVVPVVIVSSVIAVAAVAVVVLSAVKKHKKH